MFDLLKIRNCTRQLLLYFDLKLIIKLEKTKAKDRVLVSLAQLVLIKSCDNVLSQVYDIYNTQIYFLFF